MLTTHRKVRTVVLDEKDAPAMHRAIERALFALDRDAKREDLPAVERDAARSAIPFLSVLSGSFSE